MSYEKGERTRRRIIERTGARLNTHGYAGTTIDDILAATGLTKGGLYRHFPDKDAVALEAYRFNLRAVAQARSDAVGDELAGLARLRRLIEHALDPITRPAVKGGCPILNLATESDDTRPKHRLEARKALALWRGQLAGAGRDARAAGELRGTFDPDGFASFAISAVEGAIMQAHLLRDGTHLRVAVTTLLAVLDAQTS